MIIVHFVFWLFAIPCILIFIGVVWLGILAQIGRVFGCGE